MSGRSWELEVCSVCGTVCGPPNDVPAAHTSEVSSCAEEGGQIERVRVYEHPTKPAAIEAWTCLSCGAIGRAQSCAECGGESQPGRWVRAGEHPTDGEESALDRERRWSDIFKARAEKAEAELARARSDVDAEAGK
jgi:hypothetical protein